MFAPHAYRVSVSCSPRSSVVIGGALAPAACAARAALQARPDRPGEHVDVGVLARGREQRVQPAGAGSDVVVDEHHQLAGRALDAGVARDVQAQRRARAAHSGRRTARASARASGEGPASSITSTSAPAARGLRGDRGERDLQVGGTRARGDHDRGWYRLGRLGGASGAESLGLTARWSCSCTTATARPAGRSASSRTCCGSCASICASPPSCSTRDSAALGSRPRRGRAAARRACGRARWRAAVRRERRARRARPQPAARRSAGARSPRRARPGRAWCCTCTSTGSSARSASASRAAPSARAATGATRCRACG